VLGLAVVQSAAKYPARLAGLGTLASAGGMLRCALHNLTLLLILFDYRIVNCHFRRFQRV